MSAKIKGMNPKVTIFIAGFVLGLVVALVAGAYVAGRSSAALGSASKGLSPTVVFDRVKEQDHLVCASQNYAITDKSTDSNKIPFTDIEIPGTQNSFWYRYCGTLEASVELSTAGFSQDGNKITITLDQPSITSNTPDMEKSGVLEENNNFLNPIHIDQVDEFQRACVERSEQEAKEGGLLDEAETRAADNLVRLFNGAFGDEYEVAVEFRNEAE